MKITKKILDHDIYVSPDKIFPIYLIAANRSILIDSGVSANFPKISDFIESVLNKRPLDGLLLTHSHYDHVGSCTMIQEKYGSPIYCSQRTKEILENKNAITLINDLNQNYSKLKKTYDNTKFVKPKQLISVKEFDNIEIEVKRHLLVLETPGHTRCSISFMLEPDRVLFCGDAAGIISSKGKTKPLFLSSFIQYEKSLKKMIALDAATVALPHNQFIKGREAVKQFFQQALDAAYRIKELIIKDIVQKKPIDTLIAEFFKREFPDASNMGPMEAILLNISAMVRTINREFIDQN